MKKLLVSLIFVFTLMGGCLSESFAGISLTGVTIKKTGVYGAYTYMMVNLSGSTTDLWLLIPTGDTYNAMLATALSAQSAGKTVRLSSLASSFQPWQPISGIMMED